VFAGFGIGARIIPNIVDLNRFVFRRRDPLQPRLLSTRNFEPMYNVSCTLRAFRLLQHVYPDATLTLVGAGSEDAKLRDLANQLRLNGVTFAGRVAPDAISTFYANADIYVQTPEIDNMPASVIEAYASGTPVVSTDAGGVPAILTGETHGLLARVGDHETIARHVLRLLDDRALVTRLTKNAYAACQDYTWEQVREQWLSLYRELLPSAMARRAEAAINVA
jgi:glycosyltransferase involved in cell wall biosynthesis